MHAVPEPRWQFGSEFHWPTLGGRSGSVDRPATAILPEGARLAGSGRDALRTLIAMGMRRRGWRRWFVPSYFCGEVTAAIASTGIEVVLYDDSPLEPVPPKPDVPFRRGDVFFLVNYFGLRGPEAARAVDLGPAELVEDHTHDPWSDWARSSGADFCLASLRKTLPIPDGAAFWSPRGHALPVQAPVTARRELAAQRKLAAMLLMRLYLQGLAVDKETYRELQIEGEQEIAAGDVSGPSGLLQWLLGRLPWQRWRTRRAANHAILAEALAGVPGIEVLGSHAGGGPCPFSVVFTCDTPERRDGLRSALIARKVYPAVLWPLGNAPPALPRRAVELSRRVLSLPCDFRYGADDLLRVARLVERIAPSRPVLSGYSAFAGICAPTDSRQSASVS